jgi:hypothetical protein
MGLLTLPFKLPFLPVTGTVRLAEIIADEADRQLHDPARIRRELEEAERLRDAGEISDDEYARIEENATSLLVPGLRPAEAGAPAPASPRDRR